MTTITSDMATLYNITQEDFTTTPVVHAETRPMKLSKSDYKKLTRLVLEGNVQNTGSPDLTVAVFGSTDNEHWFLLNNYSRFSTDEIILLGRSQFSCRYFILVFGGSIEEESYFTHIDLEFSERYNTKLR